MARTASTVAFELQLLEQPHHASISGDAPVGSVVQAPRVLTGNTMTARVFVARNRSVPGRWWLLRAGGSGEPGEAAEGHGAARKVLLTRPRQNGEK
jgi:hypothetical protein